jgi:hypothetical protein
MNQKVLYVAIVAVVAIVIVIGVWVSGAGQSGPLAGTINPPPIVTTLTLTAEDDPVCGGGVAYRQIQFSGTLTGDGAPIPVRPVTIYNAEGPTAIVTLNTDVNGTFSTSVGVMAFGPADYYATFTGNSQYDSCQSNIASVPAATFC